MPSDLMNRFGGQRMQAPQVAPMPQQKPSMLEQIGTGIAMDAGTDIAKDAAQPYVDQFKAGASDVLTSAQGALGNTLGLGAEAGSGLEAAMFEAAPFEAIGTEGIAATTGLGEAAAGEAIAGGLGGAGAGAGLAAAMPWVGAGLLAGKAFGLFSKGGPVNYASCGGKMPKYRANGGYTYDQYKEDKEQEDYKKDSYGAFYRAGGGPLGLMALNKYHETLQKDPSMLSPAAALFRAEGSYNPEDYARENEKRQRMKAERSRNAGGMPYRNQGVLAALNEEIDPWYDSANGVGMYIDHFMWGNTEEDWDDTDRQVMEEYARQRELQDIRDLYENPIGSIYRAEGGDTGGFWNYLKKSFTEKPAWADDVAVQVPVTDSSGNPVTDRYGNAVTSTVYQRPAPTPEYNPYAEEGAYDEEEVNADFLAGNPEAYSVQTYGMAPRTKPKMAPLMPPEYEDPYYFDVNEDFSQIKPYRREEPEEELADKLARKRPYGYGSPWMRSYYDKKSKPRSGEEPKAARAQKYSGAFSNGGMVNAGPLKSMQYKSAGGEVYTQSYYHSKEK